MKRVLHGLAAVLVIGGLLGVAACAAPATPTPTTAPAKPTATTAPVAKPTATAASKSAATPAAKPTQSAASKPAASAGAKPAASADWKPQWDNMVAAAKKEGKVVVAAGPGPTYRKALLTFQKAYPEIEVELTGIAGSQFAPKLIAERDGGQFLWDVHIGGASTINSRLKPKGALAPVKPVLILPEVLDGSVWLNGFDAAWADKEQQYVFQFTGRITQLFLVNRDFASESEISKLDQILDPKWKGKIATQDVRAPGPSGTSVGWLLLAKGEQWLRKFYSQDLVIVKDARTQIDWLARGRVPLAYGTDRTQVVTFQREGLGLNVKALDPADEASQRMTGGFGFVTMLDKAPHPNAAKVFINWLLTKEAQQTYVTETGDNSRRLDTKGFPETAPDPKAKYRILEKEENFPNVQKANAIAKEMIK